MEVDPKSMQFLMAKPRAFLAVSTCQN